MSDLPSLIHPEYFHLVVETPQPTLVAGTNRFRGVGFSVRMKRELLGQMSERLGPEHYGKERQAEQAKGVVGQELRRRRWTEATLGER